MVKSGGGGAASTVKEKLWAAGAPKPLLALMVNPYGPAVPAAGVPASVAVPLRLSVKVTPLGSAPLSVSAAVGLPAVVTVKVPALPTVKVALFTEVMEAGVSTVTEKVAAWVAVVPVPVTVTVSTWGAVVTGGVIDKVEVPPDVIDGGENVTQPVGTPVSLRTTFWAVPSVTAVLTVVVVATPATSVVEVGETPKVKSLGWGRTVRVKIWLAGVPAPVAVMVMV